MPPKSDRSEVTTNPYQPPLLAEPVSSADACRVTAGRRKTPRSWLDRAILFFVSLATGLQGTFAWLLIGRGTIDSYVGALFFVNVPILLVWNIQLSRLRRVGIAYGLVAAACQMVILLIMISIGLYNDPVIAINLGVASVYGVLAIACHFAYRRVNASL